MFFISSQLQFFNENSIIFSLDKNVKFRRRDTKKNPIWLPPYFAYWCFNDNGGGDYVYKRNILILVKYKHFKSIYFITQSWQKSMWKYVRKKYKAITNPITIYYKQKVMKIIMRNSVQQQSTKIILFIQMSSILPNDMKHPTVRRVFAPKIIDGI